MFFFFFFQAEDGIRDYKVTGVQTCALPIAECLGRRLHRVFFDIPLLLILERPGGYEGLQSLGGLSRLLRVCALKPSTFFGVAGMMLPLRSCPYRLRLLRRL